MTRASSPAALKTFHSREVSTTPTLRPKLEITYTTN